jgi:hypothetical protein
VRTRSGMNCGLRIEYRVAAGRPLRAAGPGAHCTNKPNFGRRGRRGPPSFHYSIIPAFHSASGRAKQSQFPADLRGRTRKTKPNLGRMGYLGDGRGGRSALCETKPIPRLRIGDRPAASGPRRPIVRNKPNWAGPAPKPTPGGESVRNKPNLEGRSCQTNQICGGLQKIHH